MDPGFFVRCMANMTVFDDGFIFKKTFEICSIMNSARYKANILALAWNACCCSPYCKNEKRSRLIRDFAHGAFRHGFIIQLRSRNCHRSGISDV
jgi:hypothetical protein